MKAYQGRGFFGGVCGKEKKRRKCEEI